VVYVHWGTEGESCPGPGQQELAAALVAAGADVVAGPGAGRLQGAGRIGEAAVAYGLGRFIADEPSDPATGVLLVQVDGRDVLDIEWVPAVRTGGVPVTQAGEDATAAAAEWDALRDCTDLTP
jgi:poly-gamma-glutamate synthesis protein (capsule biosynthesis protein)